jgi:hypothetical protein
MAAKEQWSWRQKLTIPELLLKGDVFDIFVSKSSEVIQKGKTLFGKIFTLFGKTIMPSLRQSLYLQGLTFDFYRTYFSQTLIIQGYLLTYHVRGV